MWLDENKRVKREKRLAQYVSLCYKFSHVVFQNSLNVGISTFNLDVKNSSSKYLEKKLNYTITHAYAIFPEREYHNTVTNC